MKIITQPTVYLLGKQTIVQSELFRFLKDHDVENWKTDSDIPGQILVETAGRTCYMSFEKPRPGGNLAYLKHIKEVGHGCYDIETEVLTFNGWKKWPDVTKNDRLATMDPETGILVYKKPIRLIRYKHKGKMFHVDSQHVNLLVTPDHKMYVCKTTTKEGRKKENYSLIPAIELGHVSHAYKKNCTGSADTNKNWVDGPTRDEMSLLGFAIGDGSITGRSKNQIKFHLRRERKIKWLKSLISKIAHLGYSIEAKNNDNYTVNISTSNIINSLFNDIYNENKEKQIPESVFLQASREGLEGLYDGLIQSDGSVSPTAISYDTTSQKLVGQFQQLCLHIGLSANVAYTYDKEKRKSSFGTKPLTRLHINRRCNQPEVNKWSGADGKSYWIENWEGEVFCAEVENNLLYVRRKGKPVWSGNSVLEHAVWNFLFTGVSRSLTHELVRHRAGMAYCLAGDTVIYSGAKEKGKFNGIKKCWTIKQLYKWSQDPQRKARLKLIKLRCWDGEEFVQTGIKAITNSGKKELFKITLEDGKTIRCSENHRFLGQTGWRPLKEFVSGECLATNGLPAIGLAKDYLENRYHVKKWLLSEIAAESKCSPHTIRKWLKHYGLSKPIGSGILGRIPPNKGTTYTNGYHHTKETKQKLREKKLGENNPQWKGDLASVQAGRYRAQHYFPQEPCVKCGNPKGDRHHIDRNTHNNTKENIQFLCKKCHALLHCEEDGPFNRLVVKWVKITSIEPDGYEETYDIEVDHPTHNFVANGIVTHNSQLSQRYVDEKVAEYVIPHIIKEDPELFDLWLKSVEFSHKTYVELVQKLSEKLKAKGLVGTELRKTARQAARSVLPNATETKIFVTANMRAIRHFLEQRGGAGAEREIRLLANKVLMVMQNEAPNSFEDYRTVALEDGTFEIITDTKKV